METTTTKTRCPWCGSDPLYVDYHDQEWGVPVHDDQELFEFLVLETFQAGLSWITVLKKRAHFRQVFDFFDYRLVAEYDDAKVQELLNDEGIIRNRLKVHATISNAQAFMAVQEDLGSFDQYIWAFVSEKPIQNKFSSLSDVPASTDLALTISKDLKKRGFKFVGPTVIYAFMQAIGIVNDHLTDCFRYKEVHQK